jgi:uncharacterized membrane protein
MNRVELKHISVRPPNPFAGWQQKAQTGLFLLFLLNVGLVWVRFWIPDALFGAAAWPEGALLLIAAGSTLASLSGQVPAQNAVLAAVVIGCAGGAAHMLGGLTGVPFGPFVYHPQNMGQMVFNSLPWPVPLIWVVVLLNSRGVARLSLRRFRRKTGYGFYVMGLTVVLVVLFELSWEPYAAFVKQYWTWKPTRIPSDWYTTPWTNFLGWAVTTTLILLFVTPALINKSPTKSPPSHQPLILWELLSLLLLTAAALRHLQSAVILIAIQMFLVATLSLLGSRAKCSANRTPPSTLSKVT